MKCDRCGSPVSPEALNSCRRRHFSANFCADCLICGSRLKTTLDRRPLTVLDTKEPTDARYQ